MWCQVPGQVPTYSHHHQLGQQVAGPSVLVHHPSVLQNSRSVRFMPTGQYSSARVFFCYIVASILH
jgi:hypothetical protein